MLWTHSCLSLLMETAVVMPITLLLNFNLNLERDIQRERERCQTIPSFMFYCHVARATPQDKALLGSLLSCSELILLAEAAPVQQGGPSVHVATALFKTLSSEKISTLKNGII